MSTKKTQKAAFTKQIDAKTKQNNIFDLIFS
jgi:hypothetical protein